MTVTKYVYFLTFMLQCPCVTTIGFISSGSIFSPTYLLQSTSLAHNKNPTQCMHMKLHNNDNKNKTKSSKVFKLDFSEDMEEPEEKLFKPRYAFGLSEFDMILLRIYVNIVVMIYFCNILLGKY
jgi:hypothetical protein